MKKCTSNAMCDYREDNSICSYKENCKGQIDFNNEQYTKLLEIDVNWLVNYIADMITENEDTIEIVIKTKDRGTLESIIEQYIYQNLVEVKIKKERK